MQVLSAITPYTLSTKPISLCLSSRPFNLPALWSRHSVDRHDRHTASRDGEGIGTNERGPESSDPQETPQGKKTRNLAGGPDNENEFVKQAISAALELAETGKIVGIVVNRVYTARRIREGLVRGRHRAELLTGRIRPYDRDLLLDRLLPEICAGRKRRNRGALFVVATQTIEVGADLDFDALVTEAAALDALRQRFGRLDRLGKIGRTRAVILYRPKLNKKKKKIIPDPIYGEAMHDAWKWLLKKAEKKGVVDFGIAAMEKNMQGGMVPTTESKHAPVLLPSHIGLLGQTGPDAPFMSMSPPGCMVPKVQARMYPSSGEPTLIRINRSPGLKPCGFARLSAVKPLKSPSTLRVHGWKSRSEEEVTDLEGVMSSRMEKESPGRPVLCWRGPDDYRIANPSDIRPGDTIVVPAEYGGCDQYGWAPQSEEPVKDIADFCPFERQRDRIVRLVPGLTGWLGETSTRVLEAVNEIVAAESISDPEKDIDEGRVETAHLNLRNLLKGVEHPLIASLDNRYEIERHPRGVVLRGRIVDDVEATLYAGVAVNLDRHLQGVARLTEKLAQRNSEREQIVRAAGQHDLGKAEPRFQAMLHGSVLSAAAGPLLAKSGLRTLSQVLASYAESGLPRGFRHELASLSSSLTGGAPEIDQLVRYLVATHHGYGRPWFPVCADPEAPGLDHGKVGSGWASEFAGLLRLYRPWRLAEMELLLRASDARQSKAEQEESDA